MLWTHSSGRLLSLVGGLSLLGAVSRLHATLYTPISDDALIARTRLIVLARAGASTAVPSPETGSQTRTEFEVLRVARGTAPARIRVTIPGGILPDGTGGVFAGVPRFERGAEYLLFLHKREDGSFGVNELALGAFDVLQDASGRKVAVREQFRSGHLRTLPVTGQSARPEAVRDLNLFLFSIRLRAVPLQYEIATPGALTREVGGGAGPRPSWANLFEGTSPVRWDFPAAPVSVGWADEGAEVAPGGQSGVAGGGIPELAAAVETWRTEPASKIAYVFSGEGRKTVTVHLDNVSLFGGSGVPCGLGLVGLAAPLVAGSHPWKGDTYSTATSGNVWMRRWDCETAAYPPALFQNAVTHELGHTLGLGHADQAQSVYDRTRNAQGAIMSSMLASGRPPGLGADDLEAICYLYGSCQPPAPSGAAFTFQPAMPRAGEPISFIDTSTGSPAAWSWTFGDGTTSSSQSPRHAYSKPGAYPVTLTARSAVGATQFTALIGVSGPPAPLRSVTVPVAAHVTGLDGFTFRTDVQIENPRNEPATADLLFCSANGSSVGVSLSFSPRETRAFSDVLAQFGFADAVGALRLETTGHPPAVLRMTSRTYRAVSQGTVGFAAPGLPEEPSSAASRFVTGLSTSSRTRSNLGAVNASSEPVTFEITLYAEDGSTLSTSPALLLPPRGHWQRSVVELSSREAERVRTAEFRSVSGSALPFGYATRVDNSSGDPTYFASKRPATSLYLPLVSRVTGPGAFLTSELTLANVTEAPMTLLLTFFGEDWDNSRDARTASLSMNPRETRTIEDAAALFGLSEASGFLLIESPAAESLVASQRIWAPSPATPGTVGQQVDPIFPESFSPRGAVLGLRQDIHFRSSAGLVNPGQTSASVTLQLKRQSGAILTTAVLSLPARSLLARGLAGLFPGTEFPPEETLVLSFDAGEAPIGVFGVLVDNLSQDPTFLGFLAP